MSDETTHQYLIIGAGPAGLQMGFHMQTAGMDYLILEKADTAGAFFATQPVHRTLISINKKYNLFPEEEFNWRHDWNSLLCDGELRFTSYSDELFPSADDYHQYLKDYAERYQLNIAYGAEVTHVARPEGEPRGFVVTLADGRVLRCEVLIAGLGAVRQKIPKEIEGIESATLYGEQSTDLEAYKNKKVGVVGGGNSAFETADYLAPTAAFVHIFVQRPPKMAWDSHFVGDVRAINNNIFDLYQLKSLHAVLNPRLRRIDKLEDGTYRTQHEYDYPESDPPGTLSLTRDYDVVINATGWEYTAPELWDEAIAPESVMEGKFPAMRPDWQSTNVDDLYYIGTAMQGIDRKAASGFIHGFRYNVRTLFGLLRERHNDAPYPSERLEPFDWSAFLDLMYERFSVSAALFQLFGFLSDVLILDDDKQGATYLRELPRAYAETIIPPDKHALVLTLEFGFDRHKGSALSFMGPSDPNDTECAAFLHPVIRHLHNGETREFHFGDSLLARWDRSHATGGAVMSYHHTFQAWAKEQLGLDIELPEPSPEVGAYRPWTEEEIQAHKAMQPEPRDYPCS